LLCFETVAGAATRALSLPEILRNVLERLADGADDSDDKTECRRALCSAARVNSAWAQHALDLLWQRPPERAFMELPEARRQFYASRVRSFAVERYNYLLITLSFPRLREIDLQLDETVRRVVMTRKQYEKSLTTGARRWSSHGDGGCQRPSHDSGSSSSTGSGNGGDYRRGRRPRNSDVGQYIGPQLERLHAVLNSELAMLLLERRPCLRELDIRDVEGDVVWDGFGWEDDDDDGPRRTDWQPMDSSVFQQRYKAYLRAKATAPPLPTAVQRRVLELCCGSSGRLEMVSLRSMDAGVLRDVFARLLAPQSALKSLTLSGFSPTPALLADIAKHVPTPFRALQRLQLEISAAAVPALVRLVPTVKWLALNVLDSPTADSGNGSSYSNADGDTNMTGANASNTALNASEKGGVLTSVASALPGLYGLHVTYMTFFPQLAGADVLALRVLVHLQHLTIEYGGVGESVVGVDWAPDGFVALVTPLCQLRKLKLDILADMSSRDLLHVGLACPLLTHLEMPDECFDLDTLGDVTAEGAGQHRHSPLFAHLERLVVMSFDLELEEPVSRWYVFSMKPLLLCVSDHSSSQT
jgi:hypothetical protein